MGAVNELYKKNNASYNYYKLHSPAVHNVTTMVNVQLMCTYHRMRLSSLVYCDEYST